MATSKLALYNSVLSSKLGERTLASLNENRKPLRDLDAVWDDGAVGKLLAMGQWNFAVRTVMLDYSPSIEPDFGYKRAFDHPNDWVRTVAVCSDEYGKTPLLEYKDEASFWFADLETIYVGYVSDDVQYGGDLSKWPPRFVDFAVAWMAAQACVGITQNIGRKQDLDAEWRDLLKKAKSNDAMDEATVFLPSGTWASARRRGGYGSRGSRSNCY